MGRLRFLWQELVVRRDVVLEARAADVATSAVDGALHLRPVEDVTALAPFAAALDEAYGRGYTERWTAAFAWGERPVMLLREDRLVGFGWVTVGDSGGVTYYAGRLQEREYRVSRVGVLPAERRRGYNTAFYVLLLRALFARGAQRVTIECTKDNLPSLAAITKAGFRPARELRVYGRLLGGGVREVA